MNIQVSRLGLVEESQVKIVSLATTQVHILLCAGTAPASSYCGGVGAPAWGVSRLQHIDNRKKCVFGGMEWHDD